MDLLSTASWKALTSPTHRHRAPSGWTTTSPIKYHHHRSLAAALSPVHASPPPVHSSPARLSTSHYSPALVMKDHDDGLSTLSCATSGAPPETPEFVHARLDGSLECCKCQASHDLYLMYPILKNLDTWNQESQFLCSLCHQDQDSEEEEELDTSLEVSPKKLQALDQAQSRSTSKTRRLTSSQKRSRDLQIPLISHHDCNVQECFDLLHEVEEERDGTIDRLSEGTMQTLHTDIRNELSTSQRTRLPDQIEKLVHRESQIYTEMWQRHWDLLSETVAILQDALEVQGDHERDLLLGYYQWRERSGSFTDDSHPEAPSWKESADQALTKRDIEANVGPGHFWGSSVDDTGAAADSVTVAMRQLTEGLISDDIVEELASSQESEFIQLFSSHSRGLGWSTPHQKHNSTNSISLDEAYAAEAGLTVVVRSEQQDHDSRMQESAQQVRTLLIRVAHKITTEQSSMDVVERPTTQPNDAVVVLQSPTNAKEPGKSRKLLRRTAIPDDCTTEEQRFLAIQNQAKEEITKWRPQEKSKIYPSRKKKRDVAAVETNSKRMKKAVVASCPEDRLECGPQRRPRLPNTERLKVTPVSNKKQASRSPKQTPKKRGPGRPRKYPLVQHTTRTKSVTKILVTPTPTARIPRTPVSRTRGPETSSSKMVRVERRCEGVAPKEIGSRKPRRCLRCVEFGGGKAFQCKGRGGQTNCIFFTPGGKALKN